MADSKLKVIQKVIIMNQLTTNCMTILVLK